MEFDLRAMDDKIRLMQKPAEELRGLGEAIPMVARNTARILASLKVLEINISDCLDL